MLSFLDEGFKGKGKNIFITSVWKGCGLVDPESYKRGMIAYCVHTYTSMTVIIYLGFIQVELHFLLPDHFVAERLFPAKPEKFFSLFFVDIQ